MVDWKLRAVFFLVALIGSVGAQSEPMGHSAQWLPAAVEQIATAKLTDLGHHDAASTERLLDALAVYYADAGAQFARLGRHEITTAQMRMTLRAAERDLQRSARRVLSANAARKWLAMIAFPHPELTQESRLVNAEYSPHREQAVRVDNDWQRYQPVPETQ